MARNPAHITLLDRGPVRGARGDDRRPCGIATAMLDAERAWRAALAGRTVADVFAHMAASVSDVTIRKGAEWLWEAMR